MSKRILSLVLALTLVLGSMSMAFADVDVTTDVEGENLTDAVTRLDNLGILEGYEDGTFKPENDITRAEFAAVVSRARGLEEAAKNNVGKTIFGDVIPGGWASGYINVAEGAGLIKGMGVVNGVNTFGPELNITYEQAVTMVVRALGYESSAQKNGGYPSGYLVVASQTGLLKNVNGTMGTKATRGLVAQLVDNALDIKKMIDVGFGDIISGQMNTDEKYLFDDMGFERIVHGIITDADDSKNKVTIEGYKDNDKKEVRNKGLNVSADFDFAGLEGMKVTAWYNDKTNTLVDVRIQNDYEAKFDAIKVTKSGEEVELKIEDKKYDLQDDKDGKAIVKINGSKKSLSDLSKGDKYNFAKLIINEYNNISWIEVYDLDEKIVVKEVTGNTVKGYSNEEITDANDFTIVKNGKQISEKALKKEDVVLYNDKEEYAVVMTDIRTGEIERVYENGFKFEGETYNYREGNASVEYIVNEDLEEVDKDVAEEMQDSGEVSIVFSYDDLPLLMDGDVTEISSNYVMVESDTKQFSTRGEVYQTLDVLNSQGGVVEYQIKVKDINDKTEDFLYNETKSNKFGEEVSVDWVNQIKEGNVIELSLDSANKPSKVEKVDGTKQIGSKALDVDATYIEGYRTKANATVFWADGEKDVEDFKVFKWSEAEDYFTEISEGVVFADDRGDVVAVYAKTTNNETKTEDYVGVIKKVKELSRKDNRYDITIEINGKEETYEGKDSSFKNLKLDDIVALEVTEDGEARGYKTYDTTGDAILKVVTVERASGSSIVVKENGKDVTYNMRGKYYDVVARELEDIKTSDIFKNSDHPTLTLYFQPGATRNVQVAVLGDNTDGTIGGGNEGPSVEKGIVNYINTAGTRLEVDGVVYTLNADTRLVNEAGTTIAIGNTDISANLSVNDMVEEIKVVDGVVTILVKVDATEAAKVTAATAAVVKAEGSKTSADIAAAQTLVNGLAAGTAKTNLQNRINQIAPEAPGTVTAELTKVGSALGVSSYAITVNGAELTDVTDVKVDGVSKTKEIKDGVIRFNDGDATLGAVTIVVNGETINVTVK